MLTSVGLYDIPPPMKSSKFIKDLRAYVTYWKGQIRIFFVVLNLKNKIEDEGRVRGGAAAPRLNVALASASLVA